MPDGIYDIITPEKAIKEIHECINEIQDDEYILKIYQLICWKDSELKDGKIWVKGE